MKLDQQQVFDDIVENAEIIAFCNIDLHVSKDLFLTCRFKHSGCSMVCDLNTSRVEIQHDGVVADVTPYRSGLATMTFKRELQKQNNLSNALIACNHVLCS